MKINRPTKLITILVLSVILGIIMFFNCKNNISKKVNCISDVKIDVAAIKDGKRIEALGETVITYFLNVEQEDKEILYRSWKNRSVTVSLKIPKSIDTTFGHSKFLRFTLENEFKVVDLTMLFANAEPEQIAGLEALFKRETQIIVKDKTHEWIFKSCE